MLAVELEDIKSKAFGGLLATVLLRDNVADACNLFRVTSSFVLIKFESGMRISLDYQPIEVNTDITTESYATECNCKDKATRIRNFVVSQAYIYIFTHSYKI